MTEEYSEGSHDGIAPWKVGSDTQISVVTREQKIAPDGLSFLSLHGSISQNFTSNPGSHYRVLFFTSHVEGFHWSRINLGLYIQEVRLKKYNSDLHSSTEFHRVLHCCRTLQRLWNGNTHRYHCHLIAVGLFEDCSHSLCSFHWC